MRKLLLVLLITAFIIFVAGNSQAGTTTSDLTIRASVDVTCILSGTILDVGAYTGEAISIGGLVNVQCTGGTEYTMSYDEGQYFSAPTRRMMMEGGTDYLTYELRCGEGPFGSEADEGDCGNGGTTGNLVPDTGPWTSTGIVEAWEVTAFVPAGQFISAGEYFDTVTITLDFTPPAGP